MSDLETMKEVLEDLGFPSGFGQLMSLAADISRRDVKYDFDALKFYGDHVGLTYGTQIPEGDAAVGAAVLSAIAATNSLAGGGAAGYLAVLSLIMIAFREDYWYADDLVGRYVLNQPSESVR